MRKKRSFDYTSILIPLVLLAILVIVQVLSYRFTERFDLTTKKLHSLSEKSIKVLNDLDGSPVKATAFLTTDDFNRDSTQDLFEEYRNNYPKFEYKIVDPAKNPGLVDKYQVGSNGTIVLEYKGNTTKIVTHEEEALTNGIHKLATNRSTVVYFLTGHGEKAVDGNYSELAGDLENEHYELKELLLLRADKVPDDAQCLVIAGPKDSLSDYEIDKIKDYFEKGGSLLVMEDPFRTSGLEDYLKSMGVDLQWDTIVDQRSKMMGGDVLLPIVSDYGAHTITQSLDLISFFPITRSIHIADQKPAGVDVRYLARTGEDAWGETDYQALGDGKAAFDAEKDIPGPLTVAAALTHKKDASDSEGRMVIFGDSDFAGNDYLSVSGNKDFILNSFAWLTSEKSLIGIRSRDPNQTPIILTQKETHLVFWLFIVLLPALSAAAGLGVWLVSRWRR